MNTPEEFFEDPRWMPDDPGEDLLPEQQEDPLEHTAICPTHGREDIADHGSTGGPDPWATDILACGCEILDMGVPEVGPQVLRTGPRRTRMWQGDLENGPSVRDWQHP